MKSDDTTTPQRTGWRRYFTGQRLRAFIILSIAAHLVLGLSWGVPAYVKQRHEDEARRRAAQLLAEQKAATEKAEAEAKAKAQRDTLADVKKQTRKAVDSMLADLPQEKKQAIWDEIADKLDAVQKQMAETLADRTKTEQDLRNVQSQLDRQMVQAVNQAINGNIQQDEVATFMAMAQSKLLPELIRHYSQNMQWKVSQPLHGDVEKQINDSAGATSKSFEATRAQREEAGKQLYKFREQIEVASRSADTALDVSTHNADSKRADELKKQLDATNTSVANAIAAGTELDKLLATIGKTVGDPLGTDKFSDRLRSLQADIIGVLKNTSTTKDTLAAGDTAGAARQLVKLSLDVRTLGSTWNAMNDESYRAVERGATMTRNNVGAFARSALPEDVKATFADAYKTKASDRIAKAITEAFAKRLESRGIKNDELVKKVNDGVKQLFEQSVGDNPQIIVSAIKPLLQYGKTSTTQPVLESAVAKQFTERSHPIVVKGIGEFIDDAGIDRRLVDLANQRTEDIASDAVSDRVATAARNQMSGRTIGGGFTAINSATLTDLRSSAVQRSDDTMSSDLSADASTQPTVDPLVDDVKRDLAEAMKRDLSGMLKKALTDEQTKTVVDSVAAASDADVTRLAQDVLDPKVSDADLEGRRTDFSLKIVGHTKDGLDGLATKDVEAELLKRLSGDAGKKLAENIRNAVKEQVGGQLADGYDRAAWTERNAGDSDARQLRTAIDSVRETANKASEILDGARNRAQRGADEIARKDPNAPDPKDVAAAERERLGIVAKSLNDVRKNLDDASKSVEITTTPMKDGLAKVGETFTAVDKSLTAADKAAESGDLKALAGAIEDAKKALEPYRDSVNKAGEATGAEANQSAARFLKAATALVGDKPNENGIAAKVDKAFEAEFQKTTAPKLTDQILNAYKDKLARGGVDASGAEEAFRKQVEAALEKQVGAGESLGKVASGELERRGVLKDAAKATGDPDAVQTDKANSVADTAIKTGLASALEGGRGSGEVAEAVNGVKGPSDAIVGLKDQFNRIEGQLRAGRGGLMADESADSDGQPGSVAGIRKKWQALIAAAGKNGSRSGQGGGAGNGLGSGGPGFGVGSIYRIDPARREELLAKLKERDNAMTKGAAFARVGATGDTSSAETDAASVHPAMVVVPTTQPSAKTDNDKPYEPTFKSLAFVAAPYLTQSIKVDGNFDDWKDIPAVYLKPERWDGKDQEGLNIVDKVPLKFAWDKHGFYFMLDMVDPDNKLKAAPQQAFWAGDTLEIYMDTRNTKEHFRTRGSSQQFWFWPAGSAEDPTLPGGESYVERFSNDRYVPFTKEQLPLAVQKTDKGYRLECRINTEYVRDADLAPGKIIGLNMTVETGTRVHYYWSASKASATYAYPDTWGDVLLGGSDGKLEIPQRLTDEKGPGDPMKTTSSFVVGQPLRLRVRDGDMNLNERVADKVMVTVANPSNGDTQVAILKETAADSGVFEGAIRTVLDIGEKTPGAVSVFDGQNLRVTYVDQARANGARDAKVSIDVKAASTVINGVASR